MYISEFRALAKEGITNRKGIKLGLSKRTEELEISSKDIVMIAKNRKDKASRNL